jgi:Cys-rich repeat protein
MLSRFCRPRIVVPASLVTLIVLLGCADLHFGDCTDDSACSSGQTCHDSYCQSACDSFTQCANGQGCDNGACGIPCTQSTDCGTGFFCQGSHCVHGCQQDSDCGTGRSCGSSGYCSGCGRDAECAAGQTCNTGTCTCAHDTDCFGGEVCTSGACQAGFPVAVTSHAPRARLARLTRFLQAMLGYGPPPSFTFELVDPAPGVSSAQRLTFDTTAGNLETFTAVVTYPPEFGFNGFTALGPANTRIGSYALDVNLDDVPDVVIPLRATAENHAYVDQALTGESVALDATISHAGAGGPHVFTIEIPRGGDANLATLVASMPVRVVVTLFAGIVDNPTLPGMYTASATFTSVDPNTDGPDDGTKEPPQQFSVQTSMTIALVTTTTLPGTGCVHAATLPSVNCRLAALRALVTANVPASALQTQLLAALTQARGKTTQVETLLAAGKKRPARSALGRAITALGSFKHRLKSRAARHLGSVKTTLLSGTADLVKDLRALRHG